MRVAAVVVKQRTILATIMNDTDGANLNTSRAHVRRRGIASHDSKHTKKNRERGKNHVEFNSVRSGRRPWSRSHRTHLEDVAIPRPRST